MANERPLDHAVAKQLEETARALIQKDLALTESNDRLAKQVAEFKFLQEVGQIANAAQGRSGIDRPIIVQLLTRLNYDRGFILKINKVATLLAFEGFEGMDKKALEREIERKWRGTLANMKPTLILENDGSDLSELCKLFQVSSLALSPLKTSNRTYGLCGIGNEQVLNNLDQSDVDFLELLTSQLAVAIENRLNLDQLRVQNLELRKLDEAKTTFLSIASHQLRTPLTVIQLALEILANPKLGQLSPQQKKTVNQIRTSNERLMSLVNDLLNLSRIAQGRIRYQPELFSVKRLVALVLREYEPSIKKRNLVTKLSIPDELLLTADQTLMKEVMSNLVDNSIKYNKVGGSIAISASQGPTLVKIEVTDTGIGIAKEDLPAIGNQFFRSKDAMSLEPNGTGLGLFIIKQIIEMHGGKLAMASEAGKGTTVTVVVPLHPPGRVESGLHLWTQKFKYGKTGSDVDQWQASSKAPGSKT